MGRTGLFYRESIFSDLNNIKVVTAFCDKYADSFGFTEEEVFGALDAFGLSGKKQEVKKWYDGFTFGNRKDIYNTWSVVNYLDTGQIGTYWANSSDNRLISSLLRRGSRHVKQDFEGLMRGESVRVELDEQIAFDQLTAKRNAIWSLLPAGRYTLISNRESGFGRYDVVLEPKNEEDDAMILEFKVQDPEEEKELSDTVAAALKQIEQKKYEVNLTEKGISGRRIRKYGFAFRGKQVLIGTGCKDK